MRYLICLLVFTVTVPAALASSPKKPLPFSCESFLILARPQEWTQVFLVDYAAFNRLYDGQGSSVEFQISEHLSGIETGILPDLLQEWGIEREVLLTLSPDPGSKTLVQALKDRLETQSKTELDRKADPRSDALGESFYLPVWVRTRWLDEVIARFKQTNHYRVFASEYEIAEWTDLVMHRRPPPRL